MRAAGRPWRCSQEAFLAGFESCHQRKIRRACSATQNATRSLCLRIVSALNLPPGKSGRANKKECGHEKLYWPVTAIVRIPIVRC